MSDDPMRERMVDAIAGHLEVPREQASAAMNAAWEATKDVRGGGPPSWQPDMDDPGQRLARRVQAALEREFSDEPLFPCVVVVQDDRSRRIGIAATAIHFADVELLLRLGMGTARRIDRQFREAL